MIRRLGALAAGLALSACVVVAPPEVPQAGWILPGTSWKLTELDGKPFAARAVATLTEDGRIVGDGPCNAFTAAYSGHWPDLRFHPVANSRLSCPDIAAETAFFAALVKVEHGAHDGDALVFTGPGASLRFVRA